MVVVEGRDNGRGTCKERGRRGKRERERGEVGEGGRSIRVGG